MFDKAAATLTPKAQHPERTKTFVSTIVDAFELFEDHIGSLDEDLRTNAYMTLSHCIKMHSPPFGIWQNPRTWRPF